MESRTHRWAPETDLQWGPRHLDIHRGKTPGTSGPLTLWLCCSWNKLLIRLAGGELAPRLSLVSPKVFSPFCHRWSFRSLPLSPLACLVGYTSFPAQSSTWLHRYYLNWTKLDNAITKFNNEMHSADNWVLNPVILHYWHNLPIFEPFPTLTVWFWDQTFHTDDNRWTQPIWTHLQILQKIQTLLNRMKMFIFFLFCLNSIFFHLVLPSVSYKRYLHVFQRTN